MTTPKGVVIFLAAGEGFEPSHTESESAVLPLHKPAMPFRLSAWYIIITFQSFVKLFLQKVFHGRRIRSCGFALDILQ